jgi:hypothetical protein
MIFRLVNFSLSIVSQVYVYLPLLSHTKLRMELQAIGLRKYEFLPSMRNWRQVPFLGPWRKCISPLSSSLIFVRTDTNSYSPDLCRLPDVQTP